MNILVLLLTSILSLNIKPGDVVEIKQELDLNGCEVILPSNVTLSFKGGIIRNGILTGNDTKVECDSYAFDNVCIQGTWNVPVIYSKWFKNLDYVNSLKDVMALTSPGISNKVIIGKGIYEVALSKDSETCLEINSNTEVILNGTIRLRPNDFPHYYILGTKGKNIVIQGSGNIIGDRYAHKGTKGEWGMGINVIKSENVVIDGITVSECWGDCIYIGQKSKNICVRNCSLSGSRRQGISVTSADNVVLRDLNITNIQGTSPEYAIDIEPNRGGQIGKVHIENISAYNCRGGILVFGNPIDAPIGKVVIKNCTIKNTTKLPFRIERNSNVEISRCNIVNFKSELAIKCVGVDSVTIRNNAITNGLLDLIQRKTSNVDNISVSEYKYKNVRN